MPYATNETTRIYYEVEGEGPPLVLYHGTTQWSGIWRSFGYVDALKDDYRLILLDSRGHGQSPKPVDGDYSHDAQVRDVVSVLDDCSVASAHFFGFSTGGLVGYRLGANHLNRVRSLIIGGAQPYATPPATQEWLAGFAAVIEQGPDRMTKIADAYESLSDPMREELRDQLRNSDPEVFLGYIEYESNTTGLTDEALIEIATPALIYAGDHDEAFAGSLARRSAAVMPNARYVEIPDADHLAAQARTDVVLPMITDFLRLVDDR